MRETVSDYISTTATFEDDQAHWDGFLGNYANISRGLHNFIF